MLVKYLGLWRRRKKALDFSLFSIYTRTASTASSIEFLPVLRSRVQELEWNGINLEPYAYEELLQACARLSALHEGRRIHSHIARCGFGDRALFLQNTLLNVYAKCGSVRDAIELLESMELRNAVSWNVVIGGFARSGHRQEALEIFGKMMLEGVRPGRITFTNALLACEGEEFLPLGRIIHSSIQEAGITDQEEEEKAVELGNGLIAMYGRCGDLAAATQVYYGVRQRTIVSWNSIIAAYAQSGHSKEAFQFFQELLANGTKPSSVTFLAILPACSSSQEVDVFSALIREAGLESDVLVSTCLITTYGKAGSLENSRRAFAVSERSNVVTWNAMLTAVSSVGKLLEEQRSVEVGFLAEAESLRLFREMLGEGLRPARVTFLAVLNSSSPSPRSWEWIHRLAFESGVADVEPDVAAALGTAFVRAHGRRRSSKSFDQDQGLHRQELELSDDVLAWTSAMTSCSQKGLDRDSLAIFRQMQLQGIHPTSFTLAVALESCAKLGDYEQGSSIHRVMALQCKSDEFVATALVNLYSRCGDLAAARAVFDGFQGSTLVLATALIAGYSRNGDGTAALQAYQLMQLHGDAPNDVTFVTILSACSHAGLLDEGVGYFQAMAAEHSIEATAQHYGCVVDLLARLGHLEEAEEIIEEMPFLPGSVDWLTLLGGNRNHGDLRQGERAIGELERGFLAGSSGSKWRL
ncbi:pentatricopeptide repeat-containing protein At3g53360, mitochondrial [Selaginella moellendorffii]|uniref:pentatricopeptide repeat-containing protein At3g53360, mitochondrial n=1 Tax=Selaginella moellendorffii TaxID=88036 RepID=UPI000D1CB047|nr:pentatricopeptide repeat-containing protein At3g53360, mitochondrial [Selaginella moellendorffii]|eukprot:XP_024534211.1 pentatricopeptide repeat-containing protein At3g53360, mitochondrial [Selaginella moellendorffii]